MKGPRPKKVVIVLSVNTYFVILTRRFKNFSSVFLLEGPNVPKTSLLIILLNFSLTLMVQVWKKHPVKFHCLSISEFKLLQKYWLETSRQCLRPVGPFNKELLGTCDSVLVRALIFAPHLRKQLKCGRLLSILLRVSSMEPLPKNLPLRQSSCCDEFLKKGFV